MTAIASEAPRAAPSASPKRAWPLRALAPLSLRQRLLLLLCLAALPGMAVAVALTSIRLKEQTAQIESSVERLARIGAAHHERVIESARTLLDAIAQSQSAEGLDRPRCATFLEGWVERYPAFTSLSLFDEGGKLVCSSRDTGELPTIGRNRDWLQEARARNDFVLGDYALGKSGRPLVVAARPVRNTDGDRVGFVALGIELRWLDFLASTIKLPENGTITALDRKGVILSHNRADAPAEDAEKTSPAPPSEAARKAMAERGSGTLRALDATGSPRVYGFHNTRSGSIVVAVGLPRFKEYFEYGEAFLHTLLAPLAIILLALIVTGVAAELFVTRHVRRLTRTAEAIAGGDLSARTDVPYDEHEIGQLAESFDEMAAAIEQQEVALRDLAGDREVLLREMNHRVKNNMQVILAMLQTERRQTDSEAASERLSALAGRIRCLADVHRLLHEQSSDADRDIDRYAPELARLLADFYGTQDNRVRVVAEVDTLPLSMDQAVSFGMVVNELVSNAHKHAFPGEASGTITIRAARNGGEIHLVVEDDGVGMPEDRKDDGVRGSTGMRITDALVRQLRGRIEFEPRERGTAVHVRFPVRGADPSSA